MRETEAKKLEITDKISEQETANFNMLKAGLLQSHKEQALQLQQQAKQELEGVERQIKLGK